MSFYRFGFLSDIALIRDELVAVTDFSGKSIRLIDLARGQVTTLCDQSGNCDFGFVTSVAYDGTSLYVGNSDGELDKLRVVGT